jgi:hypothetical protein
MIYGTVDTVTLDLSDTKRSPGLLPVRTPLPSRIPFVSTKVMDQIRAKAKQALPAAPATVPPVAPGFKVNPIVALAGVGLVAFLVFRGKKGAPARG